MDKGWIVLASRADQLTFIYFVKHAASLLGSTPMMSNSSFADAPRRGLILVLGVKENLMAIRIFAILFSTFFGTFAHAQEGMRERSDWRKFFSEFLKGTIVVADERQTDRVILVFDQVRQRNATAGLDIQDSTYTFCT